MRAVGVALDNRGAVGHCRDVPADVADLRSDLRRLEAHLNRLLYVRNHIALELYVGVGVLGIDNALERIARMRGIHDLARFGIYGSEEAVVVDDAAAETHLLYDIEHMSLAVLVEDGDDTHGIYRVGIELAQRECFRLMGVKDEDYERVAENQSKSSLYHCAGDSIVTSCLMSIFGELFDADWKNKTKLLIEVMKNEGGL